MEGGESSGSGIWRDSIARRELGDSKQMYSVGRNVVQNEGRGCKIRVVRARLGQYEQSKVGRRRENGGEVEATVQKLRRTKLSHLTLRHHFSLV